MHTGKISEAVLKRSVLRKVHKDISVQCREFYGEDCAFYDAENEMAYVSVCDVAGFEKDPGKLILVAANNLYAGGARPEAVMLQVLIPQWYEEKSLQTDMKAIADEAERQGMRILGGHTQVSDAVNRPIYTVTGIGSCQSQKQGTDLSDDRLKETRRPLRPGDELILTKWIALAGTAALALNFEEELKGRYPFSLIDHAKEFEKLMSVAKDARAVNHFGPIAVHDLSQGGVLGALWEMAEHANVGLEVDLKRIPVKQETVEICEFFDVNPYELYSAGALLVGTDHGESLVRELEQHAIPAAVIGRVTDTRDRIIQNGEDVRYLDRPQQDAWYKLTEKRRKDI